ncbi:MAG: polysaccharide biosynthesis/export family protein [Bacteroidota bacterium]
MPKGLSYLLMIATLWSLTSCLSNQQTELFQEHPYKVGEMTEVENAVPKYRLQTNDVLAVRVKSVNSENVRYFNNQSENMVNVNNISNFLNGYNVDETGKIILPEVGAVNVGGKTMNEAREAIQSAIQKQVPKATVFVTLVSFKISILGEVVRPGYYYVYNNQLNVLEALAMAGDLDDYADRKRIQLIRQTDKGSQVTLLDLTDPKVVQSPYFYLQPNDGIYVPPLEVKNNRHNLANLTVINVLLTGITTGVAVISLITRN